MALVIIPTIIMCVFPFLFISRVSPIAIFIITVLAILIIVVIKMVSKSKKKQPLNYYTVEDYKNYVVHRAIGNEVQELVYEPYFGMPQSVYKDLGVISLGNIYRTEDLITGKYNDVYFAQSDLVVELSLIHI